MKNKEYLQLIKEGTERSYSKLYTELTKYLKSFAYNRYKNINEDIISEVIFNINKSLHIYDSSRSSFTTWCSSILINQYKNEYRRNISPSRDYRLEYSIEESLENENHSNIQLIADEYDTTKEDNCILMEQTIKDLGYEELYQFLYTDKRQKEIAEDFNVNYSTMKSTIHTQKKKLIKKMSANHKSNI